MHRYLLVAFLASVLTLMSFGCGGGDSSASSGGGDSSASSDQSAVSTSLIRAGDLPAEAKEVNSPPPSPCDPLMVFAQEGSEFAKSSMFAVGKTKLQEAVGQFATSDAAARAYDALNAKSRLMCIRNAIALQGDLSIEIHSPHNLDAGDKAEATLFEVRRRGTGQRSSIEVASVRSGPSVASLIFLAQTEKSDVALVGDVVGAAAELLARGGGEG